MDPYWRVGRVFEIDALPQNPSRFLFQIATTISLDSVANVNNVKNVNNVNNVNNVTNANNVNNANSLVRSQEISNFAVL